MITQALITSGFFHPVTGYRVRGGEIWRGIPGLGGVLLMRLDHATGKLYLPNYIGIGVTNPIYAVHVVTDGDQRVAIVQVSTLANVGILIQRLDGVNDCSWNIINTLGTKNLVFTDQTGAYLTLLRGTESPFTGSPFVRIENDVRMIWQGVHVFAGAGSPEGVATAPEGSWAFRTDPASGSALYFRPAGAGTGDTGWVAIGTPSGTAGGDLSGTYPNPIVAKIQGYAIQPAAPSDGNILVWSAANARWEPTAPTISGGAGGDLSGTYPDPAVAKIQGYAIQPAAPGDGDVLTWSASNNQWEPAPPATAGGWTAHSLVVSPAGGGTPTTTDEDAAYTESGDTVTVRIWWKGTIPSAAAGLFLTLPHTPKPISSSYSQPATAVLLEGASYVPVYAMVEEGSGNLFVSKFTGAGDIAGSPTVIELNVTHTYQKNA